MVPHTVTPLAQADDRQRFAVTCQYNELNLQKTIWIGGHTILASTPKELEMELLRQVNIAVDDMCQEVDKWN